MLVNDVTLGALVEQRPADEAHLRCISGMGEAAITHYGAALLQVQGTVQRGSKGWLCVHCLGQCLRVSLCLVHPIRTLARCQRARQSVRPQDTQSLLKAWVLPPAGHCHLLRHSQAPQAGQQLAPGAASDRAQAVHSVKQWHLRWRQQQPGASSSSSCGATAV